MLDYIIPAGEIEVGEVAIIVLTDSMNWEIVLVVAGAQGLPFNDR